MLLFISVRTYILFQRPFLSRFKAVRVIARICACAVSYEPLLLERISGIVHNHLLLIIGLDKHHF